MFGRLTIVTPEQVELELELAGLGSRFAAWLIDTLLIGLLFFAIFMIFIALGLGMALGLDFSKDLSEVLSSTGMAILVLMYFGVTWGYGVLWEGLDQGRTPGKRYMGLRVVRRDGFPIQLREAALRNLARAADMLPPPFYAVGAVMVVFHPQHQRLGDLVADTVVVAELTDVSFGSKLGAVFASRVEQGQSRQALVGVGGTVSVRQLELIEQYLERAETLSPERRALLAKQLALPVMEALGIEPERPGASEAAYEKVLREVLTRAQSASPTA